MKKIKLFLALALTVSLFTINIIIFPAHGQALVNDTSVQQDNIGTANKEILVKFRPQASQADIKESVKNKLSLSQLKQKKKFKSGLELLELGQYEDLSQVIKELNNNPGIEYAQPNYRLNAFDAPADLRFSEQWSLFNSGQSIAGQSGVSGVDVNALPAWEIAPGFETVAVAVLDTGIDLNHPDLAGNIFTNPNEIPDNGIDDDLNGYIDDVNGWDFANNDNIVFDSVTEDVHGTHVAGIIAASADNLGVRGVAPNVKILPLKFINGSAGYTSDAIEAIEYASSMGVKIINCSWGGTETNPALYDAMATSNILFVTAAGNYGSDVSTTPVYPATFDLQNVLSVAAIDNKGMLASFSSFGQAVDVAAPGVSILSTTPGQQYGYLSGTSMAAPHVTGIAALLQSNQPGLSSSGIISRIKTTVVTRPSLQGKVNADGWVNAYTALTGIVPSSDIGIASEPLVVESSPPGGDSEKDLSEVTKPPINNDLEENSKSLKPFLAENNNYLDIFNPNSLPALLNSGDGIQNLRLDLVKENTIMVTWTTNVRSNSEFHYGQTKELANKIIVDTQSYTHQLALKDIDPKELKWFQSRSKTENSLQYQSDINKLEDFLNLNKQPNKEAKRVNPSSREEQNNPASPTTKADINPLDIMTFSYVYEQEPNNDSAAATPVPLATVSGYISNWSDYDWYKVNLQAGRAISVQLKGIPYGDDYDLQVYDASLNLLYGSYWYSYYDENIDFVPSTSGTYYIKVYPYYYDFYSYHSSYYLMLAYGDAKPDSYEPNDYKSWATIISNGVTYYPTLHVNIDEDWFKVYTATSGKLVVTMENVPYNTDYDMAVYNSNGSNLGGSYAGSNSNEKFSALVSPGYYYFRIYSFRGSSSSAYRLKAAVVQPDAYEVNDAYYTAASIIPGTTIRATIDNARDEDWYKINLTAKTKVKFDLSNIPTGTDYDITAYNTYLSYKGGSYRGGNYPEEFTLLLDPGDYYLKVYPFSGSSPTQQYSLTTTTFIPDGYELNETINSAKIISLNQELSATIDNLQDIDWYKATFDEAGVMDIQLNNSSLLNYNVALYNANNQLLKQGPTNRTDSKKFMFDIATPGAYYIKVWSTLGSSGGLPYNLKISKKDKFELILQEAGTAGVLYALKVNNPRSIKNAAVVLAYDPGYFRDFLSQSSLPFRHTIGLKTIISKEINDPDQKKIVLFYDMEDDFASDLEDQEVIIDYINLYKTRDPDGSFVQGPTTISLLPQTSLSLYDSTKLDLNKTITTAINTAGLTQAKTAFSEANAASVQQLSNQENTHNVKEEETISRSYYQTGTSYSDEQLEAFARLKEQYAALYSNDVIYNGARTIKQKVDTFTETQLFDPQREAAITGVIRVPVGSGMRPEKIKVTLSDTSTFGTATPVSRSIYPNPAGRFRFEHLPAGIGYTISLTNENNITQQPVAKPIFGSAPKHLGALNDSETMIIQDIGYFYQFDFNGNNISNEPDEAEGFFAAIVKDDGTEKIQGENYLYYDPGQYTTLTGNSAYNLDNDVTVAANDASDAVTGGSWFDSPHNSVPDKNVYGANPVNSTIPNTVAIGETGSFTITFEDISQYEDMITEDKFIRLHSPNYHNLIRKDNNQDIVTDVVSVNKTKIDDNKYLAEFTVKYEVKRTTNDSFDLEFMLANNTSLKDGFGKPLRKTVGVEWYKIQLEDGSYLILSQLGSAEAGSPDPVVALIPNGTGYKVASLNKGAWHDLGQIALDPNFGLAAVGLNAEEGEIVRSSLLSSIREINWQSLKNAVFDKTLSYLGMSSYDFADQEDIDFFQQGIKVGLDDNLLFGLYNRFRGLDKYEDEFYYLIGHISVDAAAIVFFASTASSSAAASLAADSAIAVSGSAAGLLVASTGVGTVTVTAVVVGAEVTSIVGKLSATLAATAALRSENIMFATKGKIDNLPNYNAGNFRRNLIKLAGDPTSTLGPVDAHHMFPKKFRLKFDSILGSNEQHNPIYGAWESRTNHQRSAYGYNLRWERFFAAYLNLPTLNEVLDFGRQLAQEYGLIVHF